MRVAVLTVCAVTEMIVVDSRNDKKQ